MLEALGKSVTLSCSSQIPSGYRFLDDWQRVVSKPPAPEDLIVALDASDLRRVSLTPDMLGAGRSVINIDHHVTNPRFGTHNVIDTQAAATCEILVAVADALGVQLTAPIATCLLTGIVTDTLGFRTAATTQRTLEVAMRLVAAGAPLATISREVFYQRPVSALRVLGLALSRMQMRNGVIWTEITQELLRTAQARREDASGVVGVLATASGYPVSIVLGERHDGRIDISLRAGPHWDVARVATALGGGGHPQAAGVTLDGPLEAARDLVLDRVEEMVARSQAVDE
jgi:phosphoesterase RecJ-like protein